MRREEGNVDSEKRGKLLLLAALIALPIFILKIVSREAFPVWRIFVNSLIYFGSTFVGLLWALNFQVKKKSFIHIFQASLFVLSEYLFIEFFFFQKFSRIYEAFILLALVVAVFFANYFIFLMVNVLNVNQFKQIPLAQVGRTISYISSIFMAYFFTFSLMVSGLATYILFPLMILLFFLIALLHYTNTDLEGEELFRKSFVTALIMIVLLVAVMFVGDMHEIISFAPVVGYFLCVNVLTHEKISNGYVKNFWLYIVFLLSSLFLILMLNI